MKNISIENAAKLLERSAAITVDNERVTVNPSFSMLTGEDDNEFMHISWVDSEGIEFSITFDEGNNREVKITDTGEMVMVDTDGNEVVLILLTKWIL